MDFYTDLQEAKEVIQTRKEIRLEVESWWKEKGLKFPTMISDCGIFGRSVMPRVEFFKWYEMCQSVEIKPCVIEYEEDKFVSASKPKISMAKPVVLQGISKKGFPITKKNKTLAGDVSQFDGKATLKETGLLKYHLKKMSVVLPNLVSWDMSQSAKIWKELDLYYQGYFSVAVAHGVLFEDYHGTGESGNKLSNFTESIFEPAFKWLKNKFGVGPMIVALPWKNNYHLHLSEEILQEMYIDGVNVDLDPIKSLL